MELFDFDGLVLEAVRLGASDVHIQTGFKPHFRIDGDVIKSDFGTSTYDHIEDIKSLVLDEDALLRLDKEHAVDRAYPVKENGQAVGRLRISLSKCVEGVKVVSRIIPMEIPTFEDFDMPPIFQYIADQSTGIVIVAGVTGSGKSTTIAAMLESINRNRKAHVITIEDPVEFMHEPKECIFTHREIGVNVSSYADGLRTSLRQDPDVILIGEMRDLESIRYGLMAAETGHLVFATVHSETASDIPERIISVYPESEQEQARYQIADVGLAYIAQKLVQTTEGRRRHAAFEILVLNAAARNLIRSQKSHQLDTVMQTNVRFGCTTMTRSLIDLYKSGKIDKESLIRHSPNKERARRYALEHADIDIDEPRYGRQFLLRRSLRENSPRLVILAEAGIWPVMTAYSREQDPRFREDDTK